MNYNCEQRYLSLSNNDVAAFGYCPDNFIARTDGVIIEVGNLFYELSKAERECTMQHEIGHKHQTTLEWLFGKISRGYRNQLEFRADYYAMQMTSQADTTQMLERIKEMIEEGKINKRKYIKTHPSILRRIRRIRKNIKPEHYHY